MTPEQRLKICAELARRMGYSAVQSPYKEFRFYRLVSPNGERSGLCESETEAWSLAPDFFTNAADKDALVEWLAADMRATKSISTIYKFCELLVGKVLGEDRLEVCDWEECVIAAMTADLSAVTLAACKALGIGEAEDD